MKRITTTRTEYYPDHNPYRQAAILRASLLFLALLLVATLAFSCSAGLASMGGATLNINSDTTNENTLEIFTFKVDWR